MHGRPGDPARTHRQRNPQDRRTRHRPRPVRRLRRPDRRRVRADGAVSGTGVGRRDGALRLDRRRDRAALSMGDARCDDRPGGARLRQVRRPAARGRRRDTRVRQSVLDGDALLRRHRRGTALLVGHRMGALPRYAALRPRRRLHRSPRMVGDVRHLPLGTVRVVPVLPAHRRNRLPVLPAPHRVAAAVHLARGTRRGRRGAPPHRASRGLHLHHRPRGRHGYVTRAGHAHDRRLRVQAVRHRRVPHTRRRHHVRRGRPVRLQRLQGTRARHPAIVRHQRLDRRRVRPVRAGGRTHCVPARGSARTASG